jgi:hypothetical protein
MTQKIQVSVPFKLNSLADETLVGGFPGCSGCNKKYFATPGVYSVSDAVANHWYTALFAAIISTE